MHYIGKEKDPARLASKPDQMHLTGRILCVKSLSRPCLLRQERKEKTMENKKKSLKINLIVSLISELNDNNLADLTETVQEMLCKQKNGVVISNAITVEHGAIQEIDAALENVETLIEQLDRFAMGDGFNSRIATFADREVCATVRMLMDYGQALREQVDELVSRI